MVVAYLHTKNEVNMLKVSKVITWAERQTDMYKTSIYATFSTILHV